MNHPTPIPHSTPIRQPSTLIVGGGVIGLSLAWELNRRGCSVALFERDRIGRATSWAAAGILPPANFDTATDPLDRLRGFSHRLFPAWCDQLHDRTGIDPGLRQCGGWYLSDTPGEQAAMIGMADYWRQLEIECESVGSDQLTEREPALAAWAEKNRQAAAWWVPEEYQLRSPDFLRALAEACRIGGVQLLEQTPVDDVQTTNRQASVRSGHRWHSADAVVICGGPWSGFAADSLRLEMSLVPVRGQILMLKTDTPLLKGIVNLGQRYLVCRDDGRTVVGSCEEEVGFQEGTTDAMLQSLHQFAIRVCPQLAEATREKAWYGFRPMTFDGFPMLGRVPGTENVYVAAGHYRSGVHLSCASAVVMADLITGQPPSLDLAPFRVGKQQSRG